MPPPRWRQRQRLTGFTTRARTVPKRRRANREDKAIRQPGVNKKERKKREKNTTKGRTCCERQRPCNAPQRAPLAHRLLRRAACSSRGALEPRRVPWRDAQKPLTKEQSRLPALLTKDDQGRREQPRRRQLAPRRGERKSKTRKNNASPYKTPCRCYRGVIETWNVVDYTPTGEMSTVPSAPCSRSLGSSRPRGRQNGPMCRTMARKEDGCSVLPRTADRDTRLRSRLRRVLPFASPS